MLVQIACGKNIHHISKHPSEVLKFVKSYLPQDPIILEAGAYNGEDTIEMSKFWPTARIYAFEPVPELYYELKKRTSTYSQIKTYSSALSDKQGLATFYISEYTSNPGVAGASGSLLAPKDHLKYATNVIFPKQIKVKTDTIDQWAKKNNINHIDFMWLDMQGHELTALKKALTILPKVKLIYTEVEFVKAYEGQPVYREVREWLEQQGFEVLAIDFDEIIAAQGEKIPVGHGENWFGNVIFIRKDM